LKINIKKKFIIEVKYLSNFKPNFNKLKITKNKSSLFYAKKFFYFLFFCNFLKYKKYLYINRIYFFVQPLYSNVLTILRAPYRYKLSRDQLTFSRYNIIFYFELDNRLNNLKLFNVSQIFYLLNIYYNLFNFFETNFFFKKRIKFFLNLNLLENFKFKNEL